MPFFNRIRLRSGYETKQSHQQTTTFEVWYEVFDANNILNPKNYQSKQNHRHQTNSKEMLVFS